MSSSMPASPSPGMVRTSKSSLSSASSASSGLASSASRRSWNDAVRSRPLSAMLAMVRHVRAGWSGPRDAQHHRGTKRAYGIELPP
eukprot:scaffold7112_cov219-Pinguiococcus_pyrenoidosus.AAC.2